MPPRHAVRPTEDASRTEALLQALMLDDTVKRTNSPCIPDCPRSPERLSPKPATAVPSRCPSSCSTNRSSRSQAKESLQAASSAMLASPKISRSQRSNTPCRLAAWGFQNRLGYDTCRTTTMEVTNLAQKHLLQESTPERASMKNQRAPSRCTRERLHQLLVEAAKENSPMSVTSTMASFSGDLSDTSASGVSNSPGRRSRQRSNYSNTQVGKDDFGPSDDGFDSPTGCHSQDQPRQSRQRSNCTNTEVEKDSFGSSDDDFGSSTECNSLKKPRHFGRRISGPVVSRFEGIFDQSPVLSRRRHSAPSTTGVADVMNKKIRSLLPDEKIFDLYHWDEVLQEDGDGGKVVVCKPKDSSRRTSESYVMKMKSKEQLTKQGFEEQYRKSQLRMLNLPRHPGVLPLHEVLEDDKFFYVIMEKAIDGDFFGSLLSEFQDGVMPGAAMQKLMREILEAVSYVHKQGILHRDIKPDNLVMRLCDAGDGCQTVRKVALIDFDHADPDWDPMRSTSRRLALVCGTVQFSAPEAFMGFFSQSSDLYSIGVILYLLMTGKMPYSDDIYAQEMRRREESRNCFWGNSTIDQIKEAAIDWQCNPWPEQKLCRSFCRCLLAFDPLMRPRSAEAALKHAWFSKG